MEIDKIIVATTGIGYVIVGITQYFKGSISNALIWVSYGTAQIGLWMNLK